MNYLNIKQGDIVIVRVPFSNLEGSKDRPVLVISNNEYNSRMNDIIGVKITGVKHDYQIKLNQEDLVEGKLKKTSYVDYGFVITLDKELIALKIGKVKPEFLSRVIEELSKVLKVH